MPMQRWMLAGIAIVLVIPAAAIAHAADASNAFAPIDLSLQQKPDEPESVYAPPAPRRPDEGVNEGGVHFDLEVGYFNKYIYRGVEIFELPQFNPTAASNNANLQVNAKLSWDLGKLPHPFIAVFSNVADSDPVSTFQEIRPYAGFDWALRPFMVSGGYISYIYPDRDAQNTAEFFGRVELDDSYFLKSDKPFLSPYIFAAYDIDLYNGWYFEGGVSHEFQIPDIGVTLTAKAAVAYVQGNEFYATTPGQQNVTGWQHYQFGLVGKYSLNKLFNVPNRYGDWSLVGYLYYTDGIDNDLQAATTFWGGAAIQFKY